MYLSRIASLAVSFAMLSAVGATAPGCVEAEDANEAESEDALISFPAAAYASAKPIAYGGTVTQPFTRANQFVAVKFNGTKGDSVQFSVTANRETVSYLVFDKKNVNAIRSGAPGAFRFTLTSSGEHFIMMRTRDRSDASITVTLTGERPGGTAGPFSNAEIVANTPAGEKPSFSSGPIDLTTMTLRSCVTATGCNVGTPVVPVSMMFNFGLQAPPTGVLGSYSGLTPVSPVFDATSTAPLTGKVTQKVKSGTKVVDAVFDYTITYTKQKAHLELRSEVSRNGEQWTEFFGAYDAPFPSLAVRDREAPSVPPPPGGVDADTTPLDDEEVLSRFAAGAAERLVYAPIAGGPTNLTIGKAGERKCGPRTGCSKWSQAPLYTDNMLGYQWPESALQRATIRLVVRTADSYAVIMTNPDGVKMVIEISEGKGSFPGFVPGPGSTPLKYDVTVTAEGLLFSSPFVRKNTPRTESFQLPNKSYLQEPGYSSESYSNPSVLIRFNQQW